MKGGGPTSLSHQSNRSNNSHMNSQLGNGLNQRKGTGLSNASVSDYRQQKPVLSKEEEKLNRPPQISNMKELGAAHQGYGFASSVSSKIQSQINSNQQSVNQFTVNQGASQRGPGSSSSKYEYRETFDFNRQMGVNNSVTLRPQYQNFGPFDVQRETQNSALTSALGYPTLTQPSQFSIGRDNNSINEHHHTQANRNFSSFNYSRDPLVDRNHNRSHREAKSNINLNASYGGGLNVYLNNLNNQTQVPQSSSRERDENFTQIESSRPRGNSNFNISAVNWHKQGIDASPTHSTFSHQSRFNVRDNNFKSGQNPQGQMNSLGMTQNSNQSNRHHIHRHQPSREMSSLLQPSILSPGTIQKQRHQYINQNVSSTPQNLETEPIVSSSRSRIQDTFENGDDSLNNAGMQNAILNLKNKMRDLENKYLDLANFYKQEALKNRASQTRLNPSSHSTNFKSPLRGGPSDRGMSNTADGFYPQRQNSPLRYQNAQGIAQEEIDVAREQMIIENLVKEKNGLDIELRNVFDLQAKLQEQESRIQYKLDFIEQDYDRMKRSALQSNQIQCNNSISRTEIDKLQKEIQQNIQRFEKELIKYINENFNSFTENDISRLFQSLRQDLINVVEQTLRQVGSIQVSSRDHQVVQQNNISQQQQKHLKQFKKDQSEFELNQEYTIQKLKKNVFNLQSNHDLSNLDLKKAQMLLQNLTKSASELCDATSKSREMARNMQTTKNLPLGVPNLTSPRGLALTQDQLATDIQGQVKILTAAFSSISSKFNGQTQDLENLSQMQNEFQQNISTLKERYSQFIGMFELPQSFLHSQTDSINQREVTSSVPGDSHRITQQDFYTKEIEELQSINGQLQDELRSANERLHNIQLDNSHLKLELQKAQHSLLMTQQRRDSSPILSQKNRGRDGSVEQNYKPTNLTGTESSQIYGANFGANNRDYSRIREENQSLERRLQSLSRCLVEKDREIEKLGRDLNMVSQSNSLQILQNQRNFEKPPTHQSIQIEQLQFYQQMADQSQIKIRQLIRQTQKFLISMKKLQKVVHQKQPNVQKEKQDFEDTRKELETMLKEMKKELEENSRPPEEQYQANKDGDRYQVNKSQMNPQQSGNPSQSQVRPSIYKRQQPSGSASNHIYEQHSMMTAMNPITDISYQQNTTYNQNRERSPLPLRNNRILDSAETRQGIHQHQHQVSQPYREREMFKSIEPFERGKGSNMLLTSLSVDRNQQRSPSVGDKIYGGYERDSYGLHSPSQHKQISQQQNHDIEVLLQQIRDLKAERESTSLKLMKTEREKDSYLHQAQRLEQDLEKAKAQLEQHKSDLRSIQSDMHCLKDEADHSQSKHYNQLLSPKSYNSNQGIGSGLDPGYVFELEQKVRKLEKELADGNTKAERLFEQLQLNDRLAAQSTKTISFLQDSVEAGRRAIEDQKESITQKEQKIIKLKTKLKELKQKPLRDDQQLVQGISQAEIRELQNEFQEMINVKEDEMRQILEQISKRVEDKTQEIAKLKRLLERKLKELEMQSQSTESEAKLKEKLQVLELEVSRRAQDIEDLQTENLSLNKKIEGLKESYEKRVQLLDANFKQAQQMNANLKEQMQIKDDQYEESLERFKQGYENENSALNDQLSKQKEKLQKDFKAQEKKFQDLKAELSHVKIQNQELSNSLESLQNEKEGATGQVNEQAEKLRQLESTLRQKNQIIEQLKSQHEQDLQDLREQQASELESIQEMINEQQASEKQAQQMEIKKLLQQHKQELQKQLSDQAEKLKIQQQQREEDFEQERENLINEVEESMKRENQVALDKLKEKYEGEKNKAKEALEKMFKAQLADFTQDKDQIKHLEQLREQDLQQWSSEKIALESQLKEDQNRFKTKLQSKDQEIQELKSFHQNEIQQFTSQISEFQEQQEISQRERDSSHKAQMEKLNQKLAELLNQVKSKEQQVREYALEVQQQQSIVEELEISLSQKDSDINQLFQKLNQKELDLKKAISDSKLIQAQVQTLKNEIQAKIDELTEVQEENGRLESELENYQSTLTTKEQQLQQSIESLQLQLREKSEKLREANNNYHVLQGQLEKVNSDLLEKDEELQRLSLNNKRDLESLTIKNTQLQKQLEQAKQASNTEVAELKLQISQIEQDLEEQIIGQEDLKNQNKSLEEELALIRKQRDELKRDLKEQSQNLDEESQFRSRAIAELKETIEELERKEQDLRRSTSDEIKGLNKQVKEFSKTEQELKQTITSLEEEISQEKMNYKLMETQNQSLKEQIQGLQQKENQSRQNLQHKEQELLELSSKNEMLVLESQQLKESLELKAQQVINLQNQISELQNESQMAKLLKQSLQQQIDQATSSSQDLQQTILKDQQNLQNQLKEKENENMQLQSQIEDLQRQLQDFENEKLIIEQMNSAELKRLAVELSQKEKNFEMQKNEKEELEEQVATLTETIGECEKAIDQQNLSIQELEEQVEFLKNQVQATIEQSQLDLQNLIEKHKQELAQQQRQSQELLNKKEQQIKDAILEKERAQESLKEMLNQTIDEKESLQGKLQTQLNSTLGQLQAKERENQLLQTKIDELEQQLREDQALNENKIQELQEEFESLQADYQEKIEKDRESYNQTLESNKKMIQLLRDELEKSIQKQKIMQEAIDLESEKQKEFEEKIEELKTMIHQLEGEVQKKEIEIENLQSQFKGLQSAEENFNAQLETLRTQNLNLRGEFDSKTQEYQQQIELLEAELRQNNDLIEECNMAIADFNDEKHELKAKFKHLLQVLDQIPEEQESQYRGDEDEVDLENCFERFEQEFLKQQRNWESRIEELQKDNSLLREEALSSRDELLKIQSRMAELQADLMNAVNKQESNDIQMRQKLDNTGKKVQNYKDKLIEKQKVIQELEKAMGELMDLHSKNQEQQLNDKSVHQKEKNDLISKISQAQKEISELKQLQQQQRSNSASSARGLPADKETLERIDSIEIQIMQLRKQIFMAKDQVIDQLSESFAKKIKDLAQTYNQDSILKARLSEMKSNQQIETLNSNIKLIKCFQFGQKQLLVVQAISNNECYVIDESKLTEGAASYLKQFLPGEERDQLDVTYLQIDEQQQRDLDLLEQKLIELRDQRIKLQAQLTSIKTKLTQGSQLDEKSNLQVIQMEDEVASLNKELAEIRLKNKDHQILENHLRSRLIEANEIVRSLTSNNSNNDSSNRKIIKLMEENESMRQQLLSQAKRLKQFSSKKMETDKHQMTINDEDEIVEEGDFFQGIQVADNLMGARSNQEEDGGGNLFDQSSIMGVIQEINEEERKNQTQQEIRVRELEQMLDEVQKRNMTLQNELQRSQQTSINQGDKAMFDNIKGTLIQFLKNCPLTDKNNEFLLDVVFNMMEFTDDQIQEVKDKRQSAGSKQVRSGSVSASGTNTGGEEDDVKKGIKKGIFGMFKKKEGSTTRKPEDIISPQRPIRRM